jgi:hypothetical protein
MAAAPTVALVGMRALQRDLAKLAADQGQLNKAFAAAGKQAAAPVYAAAKSALPQTSGKLANDLRVTGTKSGASIRMGRSSIRYAGWTEFGGHRKVPHSSTRDYDSRGRFLFPTAQRLAVTVPPLYTTALTHALAGVAWTNEGTQGGGVHD